jgi:hypothetical protein
MIYLIDDNQNNQRINNYNLNFVDDNSYGSILKSYDKLQFNEDLSDTSHLDFLKDAECILLHTSTEDYKEGSGFIAGSTTNATRITEFISDDGEKIPLVLFSNSMYDVEYDETYNPNYIEKINKNLFYERLKDFLDFKIKHGFIDLKILAFGKNHIKEEIKSLYNKLKNTLPPDGKLTRDNLENSLDEFRKFAKIAYPDKDFDEFLAAILKSSFEVKPFKNKLKKVTESYIKYGKNIHTWR